MGHDELFKAGTFCQGCILCNLDRGSVNHGLDSTNDVEDNLEAGDRSSSRKGDVVGEVANCKKEEFSWKL